MKNNNNNMQLIEGRNIRNVSVFRSPYPGFWKKVKGNGYTKASFRFLLEHAQSFFEAYIKGEDCTGIRIPTIDGDSVSALGVFVEYGKCVTVRMVKGGYEVLEGFHRAYTAKRYRLKLLVYVEERE